MRRLFGLYVLMQLVVGFSYAQVKVIAHRGFWDTDGSAQNSLSSIGKADSIGAFGSEFDVWMTQEGSLFVNHDRFFKWTDMLHSSDARIRKIKLDNGEPLPSLEQYLDYARRYTSLRLVLELKSLTTHEREKKAVCKIAQLLKQYGLLERTDLIAFSLNACRAFKTYLPHTKVYYLNGDLAPHQVKTIGLTGIDYSGRVLKRHPEWVQQAHNLGLEVNVWTVNKLSDMKYFIGLGVDYITTDRPVVLQQLISSLYIGAE